MDGIAPSLVHFTGRGAVTGAASDRRGTFQSQVRSLSSAGTSQKIVENMERTFSRRDRCNTASLESMVEDFSTNEGRVDGGRSIVLQFEVKTGLGGSRSGDGLGSSEGVKHECS